MTALPYSIIQNSLFCCWKYEERNGRKTKMPYQSQTGLGAKSNDPSSEALTSLMAVNNGVFSVISTEGGIFDLSGTP